MRNLFLMRHGKAAWPDGVPDHRRPLAPRGQVAVPLIAGRLKTLASQIDLCMVSDATRTQETFALIQTVIPDLQQQRTRMIYEAPPDILLEVVEELPSEARTVLMIGHNPGLHAVALFLADPVRSDADAYSRLERKLPTAGLIHLQIDGHWREIGPETARLATFVTPSLLGGTDED